jgi:hypothetical protein
VRRCVGDQAWFVKRSANKRLRWGWRVFEVQRSPTVPRGFSHPCKDSMEMRTSDHGAHTQCIRNHHWEAFLRVLPSAI